MKAKKLKEMVNKLDDNDDVGFDMEDYIADSCCIIDACEGEDDKPIKLIVID